MHKKYTVRNDSIFIWLNLRKKKAIDKFFKDKTADMEDEEFSTFYEERDKYLTDKERKKEDKAADKDWNGGIKKAFIKAAMKDGKTRKEAEYMFENLDKFLPKATNYMTQKQGIELGKLLY